MIKAVLFDFGKVLSSSSGSNIRKDIADAYCLSEDAVGNSIGKFIADFRTGKINEDEFWILMSKDLNKPVPENKYQLWRKGFEDKLTFNEELFDLIKILRANGFKVGVVSNVIPPSAEIIRKRGGYKGFDSVILSCEVGFSKPQPDIYNLALKELKVKAQEVLYIDDREENIKTATDLGMETVFFVNTNPLKNKLEKLIEKSKS